MRARGDRGGGTQARWDDHLHTAGRGGASETARVPPGAPPAPALHATDKDHYIIILSEKNEKWAGDYIIVAKVIDILF